MILIAEEGAKPLEIAKTVLSVASAQDHENGIVLGSNELTAWEVLRFAGYTRLTSDGPPMCGSRHIKDGVGAVLGVGRTSTEWIPHWKAGWVVAIGSVEDAAFREVLRNVREGSYQPVTRVRLPMEGTYVLNHAPEFPTREIRLELAGANVDVKISPRLNGWALRWSRVVS